jgi:hypothetical protein
MKRLFILALAGASLAADAKIHSATAVANSSSSATLWAAPHIPAPTGLLFPKLQVNCTYQVAGAVEWENGVTNKNCCTNLTVLFARGTNEVNSRLLSVYV